MQNFRLFSQFVNEICATNSRNDKLEILAKYKNNDIIQCLLKFIYDPFVVTGISDKKLNKPVPNHLNANDFTRFEDAQYLDLLNYVSEHNTGTDNIIASIQLFRDEFIEDDVDKILFNKIITKNLQLGITATSINKVIPNLIPEFCVQLANKYFEKPEIVEGKEFTITRKIDGQRIIAIKQAGNINFYTRQGQLYSGLVDLEAELSAKFPDNICLDGEITLLDKGNLSSKEQYKQTTMLTHRDGEKHGVKMLVFDMMSADEFRNHDITPPYKTRRETMEKLFDAISPTYFELLENLYTGIDTSEISRILTREVSAGEEGIMLNMTDASYAFKRTDNLLKVKLMQTLDLEIVGVEEGSNSNKNKLGAFIVRYKDGNLVKVGSGYSKELRTKIWESELLLN